MVPHARVRYAFAASLLVACCHASDQTDITGRLNGLIQAGDKVYNGGTGVMLRNLADGQTWDKEKKVVAASFLTNDIVSASIAYPNGDPMCPNKGSSGYEKQNACTEDAWIHPVVLAVVGSDMDKLFPNFQHIQDDNWGWGVFYGTDSNSADQRCRWLSSFNGWDCPGYWLPNGGSAQADNTKKGAGFYASGNPYSQGGGGGAGCHWKQSRATQDQFDADGTNLVSDNDCQCNYALKGNGWQDWVDQWLTKGKSKPTFSNTQPWFSGGKAPSWALDLVSCWVNNPRDMIYIQNMIWFHRFDWSNQLIPQSNWGDATNPQAQRYYWGWNEVPVDSGVINNAQNWDALVIKLPAAICQGQTGGWDKIECMDAGGQNDLQDQLAWYEKSGFLKKGEGNQGNRPGSYVVLLREWQESTNKFQRYFFCQSWNANEYQIVFKAQSGNFKGECYVDQGNGPAPAPPPPPPPPPAPPCSGQAGRFILDNTNPQMCMDVPGENVYNGAAVQIWGCNGHKGQNFKWCSDGRIVSELDESYCLDIPYENPSQPNELQWWQCSQGAGQYWRYDDNDKSVYPAKTGEKMCMDTSNGGTSQGTKVNTYYCNPGSGMRWLTQPIKGNFTAAAMVI